MTSRTGANEAGHVLMECEQLVHVQDFAELRRDMITLFTRYSQVAERAPGAPMPMVAPVSSAALISVTVPN